MTHSEFNKLVDSLEEIRINTLKTKNSKYAPENDALHNFHVGAEIMGVTTQQCIWGYATKHIVALRDKIIRNDWEDKEDVLEKIQDIQNYLTFIWCSIHENENITTDKNENKDEEIWDDEMWCDNCKYAYIGDNDADWDGDKIITEPCKSCKNNFCLTDKEYLTAPNNFVKQED